MLKRALDIVGAVAGLMLLSPVLVTIAITIRLRLGGPVLFSQRRPGLHGVPFRMFKFRTMIDACDATGIPLPDSERLTPIGKLLRSTSLDELPELVNVLRGDMSLVGPRPLLMDYLSRYSPEERRRHELRPGVTGWAQINGRNTLSWEDKFALDVWYVDNRSLWLDLRIIWLTLVKVVRRDGISQEGEATVVAFDPALHRRCVNQDADCG